MSHQDMLYELHLSRVRLDGYIAGTGGSRSSENPHPKNSDEHFMWNTGWKSADLEARIDASDD